MKKYEFKKALPVWQKDMDKVMHHNLIFRTVVEGCGNTVINISASNMYQMFVNGKMVAEGPARAGHNYYRVDEIDISEYLSDGDNIVAIIVDSYYIKNFYLLYQPGFLCAEVVRGGKIIAATGDSGFEARYYAERVRKVDRCSYQRTFTEVYRLDASYRDFMTDVDAAFEAVELVAVEDKKFIERGVPYPCYDEYPALQLISRGEFAYLPEPEEYNMRRWLILENESAGWGFERSEAEIYATDEMDKCKCTVPVAKVEPAQDSHIGAYEYAIYDIGREKTGFIMLDIDCDDDTEIVLSFDELLTDGDVCTRRFNFSNAIVWYLSKGSYILVANEPNSLRYIKLANKSDSAIVVRNVGIKEYEFDYKSKGLGSSNAKLNAIYDAAVETFRQNTLDIYMDCPSRERAGWLCDSYFTSKVEHHLTGKSLVERNFLENFIMAENFDDIPDYMFAMCYPSDFAKKDYFIPNWAMWYVVELGEYFDRTGDREMVDYAKDKIEKLYEYFESLANSDGLLENLESWVFLEWSKANEFTQNVNYPSNMMYALMLRNMGRLYDEKYIARAEEIERVVTQQCFYDGFFHDHAVRGEDGKLTVIDADVTETCQYYAFFTGLATPDTYPELWEILLRDFGPDRAEKGLWKEIYPANAFIGNYLRLCLLERYGEIDKMMANIEGYFYYMAEQTGTLWENMTSIASCNHGFASLVAVWLDKYAK